MISLHNDYVSLRADEHDGMTVVSLKFKGMELLGELQNFLFS